MIAGSSGHPFKKIVKQILGEFFLPVLCFTLKKFPNQRALGPLPKNVKNIPGTVCQGSVYRTTGADGLILLNTRTISC